MTAHEYDKEKDSGVGQPWERRGSVAVCGEKRILCQFVMRPFNQYGNQLDQTVPHRAEQSSEPVKLGALLGDFISYNYRVSENHFSSLSVSTIVHTELYETRYTSHPLLAHRELIAFNASQAEWPLQSDPGTVPPSPPHAA